MNDLKLSLLLVVIFMTLSRCHFPPNHDSLGFQPKENSKSLPVVKTSFDFAGNGKSQATKVLEDVYTETNLTKFDLPSFNDSFVSGLKKQLKVLKYKKKKELKSLGAVSINTEKLEKTIRELLALKNVTRPDISSKLSAYQLKGEDSKGNVFFTGYFTPVLKVSRKPDARYKYPLYARPDKSGQPFPTRAQIDGHGALKGKGLELAYAESLADIYFMQVQGSGIVQYKDGHQELFSYAGSNRHSYRSIGKYMIEKGYTTPAKVSLTWIKRYLKHNPALLEEILFVNKSYIFFERNEYKANPKGAGLVALTEDYSIAVDPKYIPLGSCLLSAVPIINKNNKVIRHEYRVLIAQDKGGAIKGPGHVDLYMGVGSKGQRKASALHHYGKMWLLLPHEKSNEVLASL